MDVSPGGFFAVVLGDLNPMEAGVFDRAPRWLSVRVVRGSQVDDEHNTRVPVLGQALRLADRCGRLELRIAQLEAALEVGSGSSGGAGANRLTHLAEITEGLEERLDRIEDEDDSAVLRSRLDELFQQLEALSGDKGRIVKLEDELEDLVGPDGDVVDLNERMDRLEGRAPALIADLRRREAENGAVGPQRAPRLRRVHPRPPPHGGVRYRCGGSRGRRLRWRCRPPMTSAWSVGAAT